MEAESPLLHLYLDETGARHPDRPSATAKHGFDWFAISGVLINCEDEDSAKRLLAEQTWRNTTRGQPSVSPRSSSPQAAGHRGLAAIIHEQAAGEAVQS